MIKNIYTREKARKNGRSTLPSGRPEGEDGVLVEDLCVDGRIILKIIFKK
jgi:hypothetical protein